jgi:hypothetical protein
MVGKESASGQVSIKAPVMLWKVSDDFSKRKSKSL